MRDAARGASVFNSGAAKRAIVSTSQRQSRCRRWSLMREGRAEGFIDENYTGGLVGLDKGGDTLLPLWEKVAR